MPRTTYLAILNGNVVGKRTSENRVYTHVVVGRPDYDADMKRADCDWSYQGSDFDYFASQGDTKHGGCNSAAEYMAKKRADRVAEVEAKKAAGHYDKFEALTWCGRIDLAHKQLRTGWAYYTDLQILEVTKKGA